MPYCNTIKPDKGIEIVIWQLTEDLPTLLQLWGNRPLPGYYETATVDKRRREILATALSLRQYYGHDIELHHAPNGAPFIDQGHISISHTHTYIAIALHTTCKVGVDIETIGSRAPRVAPRFLSADELAAIPTDDTSARSTAIHLAWSIKEAVFKVFPSAVEFSKDIILTPFSTLPQGSTTAHLTATGTNIEAHYTIYNGCSLAWVVE